MKPTKEKLVELYVDKNLTTYEIAEFFNVSRRTVGRWFRQYDIPVNPKQRKYQKAKKIPFTKEQKEMIVGTLLGDGFIGEHGRKNKNCRIHIAHCEKQKNLVLLKKAILGNFVNKIHRKEDKRKNSVMWSFVSVVHNEFKFFRKLFYDGNKKVIRKDLEHYISSLSLAHWVMDDGSGDGKYSIRLHTSGFSFDEQVILQNILKIKFGIRCKICEFTRNNKKLYYLSFNKRNSQILSDLIREYMIDDMKYKILPPILND
jgi:recombination protein RecA